MPDGTDKDQDSKINDSVHQNHIPQINGFGPESGKSETEKQHNSPLVTYTSSSVLETYNTVVVTNSGFPTVLSSSQNYAMPVIHNVSLLNLPDVEESLSVPSFLYVSNSSLVSMKKNKYLCGQRTVSDEVHFWLNGYVNKQNCRIWSEANPQVYVETPLHPETLTVWCALWAGGIIGPYFFKNDGGHNITVNGDRYRAMITNFFIPELNNHDVQELWFQQDGATCHTARATIDLLKDTFGDRLISRFGPVNWPPRSCDLTPLDYFLWGYVKSLVYADKPQTLDHLENNIRRVIADIRPQMLEKVIENWTSRLDYIRDSRGSPMPEIIFKM
ncbi:DUF4817 domain-containing protein [Trichonephila clavipes]|nr:DUF4817 domain-containing protein [Trichonephila clavipes]